MDKGMEVEYSDHPFYYQIGKLPVKFIKPETIKEKELRTVDDVLEHLKDLPEAKSAMSYQREAVFEGRIRQIGDKISEFETSEGKPFRLYMKYFGEPSSNSSKGFFEERNIDFSMIITRAELTSCLESIMEKDYEVDLSYLKHANRVSSKKQENSKGKVIFTILSLAIDPCKEEPLIIDDDYTITPDSSHVVKPDHVFINTSTGIPLLITEDKDKDLMHGVLQNFDQLKSFSMTEAGAEMKIFSGLVTDLENWIFTCYVRPEETKPVSIHNFHVSSVFVISHGTLNQIDDEAVKRLIRTIRGYIVRMEEATKIIGAKLGI